MDWKEDRLSSAVSGRKPYGPASNESGFAVMADTQFFTGLLHPARLSRSPA
jgi:hypothetical protein